MLISNVNTKIAEREHNKLFDFIQQNVRVKLEHYHGESSHSIRPVLEVRDFNGGWSEGWERSETIEIRKPKLMG